MTVICISCGHNETEVGKIGVDGLCDLCYRAQRDEKDLDLPLRRMALAGLRRGEERRWE